MESPARSLPTPPGTSHRLEKENHFPRVAWSESNEIHTLPSTPVRGKPLKASRLRNPPTRSILKDVDTPLPVVAENQREVTPEPSDPLADLHYLDHCIDAIVAAETALSELIEAYNTLTIRLRAHVTGNTDADASWPLFQPIRKNREVFVRSLSRDLARALQNPMENSSQERQPDVDYEMEDVQESCKEPVTGLPSPKQSPKKRRVGMTAEQVKHARDLCTTSQAVLRFLSAIFTMPAVYHLFTEQQLRSMFTGVLAIPLEDTLPTPNARKTCALAIFVIQTQRLPDEVLAPAADRIAYAIRRGIEGELGKEGKKGSISDGLKAIHDLSTTYPAIFVPAFTPLLPSLFACLLGPTYAIRAHACAAVGGFAIASASIPLAPFHTVISNKTAAFLTHVPPGTPSKKGSPMDDSAIVRTIRMLLKTNDPTVAAQGPVWALCLMSNLIVLLRNTVYLNLKVNTTITALFNLVLRHQKSSVRGLACLAWRTMTWAYFQPPLLRLPVDEEDEEEDTEAEDEANALLHSKLWKLVITVVDLGAGVSSIGALLSVEGEESLRRALNMMKKMSKMGGQNCKDALDTACQLVAQTSEKEWDHMKLLPNALFSTHPGLMTVEYSQLAQTVRPIINSCPGVEDIRSLTEEELSQPWVFMGILNVWLEGLRNLKLFWECTELPEEIHDIWVRLLQVNVKTLTEADDEAGIRRFAEGVVDVLIRILEDQELDLSSESDENANVLQTTPVENRASSWLKLALRLFVVEQLWLVVRDTIPRDVLGEPADKLLTYLAQHEPDFVVDINATDMSHASWAKLCGTIALRCETAELAAFFGVRGCPAEKKRKWDWTPAVRAQVWSEIVRVWSGAQMNWEAAVFLLAIPFSGNLQWELENDHLDIWDAFLRFTMDKALDYGVEPVIVLDQVSAAILMDLSPTHTSTTRVADMLLAHLEINDIRQAPPSLFEFVNDTLTSSYPPAQRNVITSMWLLRSLASIIVECPAELLEGVLGPIQDGLSAWVADEFTALSESEYELDVLSLYQTVLVSMQSLPLSLSTLGALAPVISAAFTGRTDKPEAIKESFSEYWQATYADKAEFADSLPETILRCLDILHNGSDTSSMVRLIADDSESVCEVEAQLLPHDEEDESDSDEPSTPKPRALELLPAFLDVAGDIGSASNPIEVPSTPNSSSLRSTLPRRPQKTPQVFDLTSDTPPSSPIRAPMSVPVTPKRSPENRRGPSSAGRSWPNKENVSPSTLPSFASIAERIAKSLSPKPSTLGKRRAPDGEEDDAVKRHKKSSSLPSLFDQDTASMEMLHEDTASTPKPPPGRFRRMGMLSPNHTATKTRRRKQASADASAAASSSTSVLKKRSSDESIMFTAGPRSPAPLRRTRSATRLSDHAMPAPTTSNRKRRRNSVEDSEDTIMQTPSKRSASGSFSSSPTRGVFEPIIAGSDDSIMLATPSGRHSPSNDLSSDDNPHIGQVTPHRIVSPTMRRVQNSEDSDPSSDDSVLAASPTRDHLARRRSAGKTMIEKLAPLMLGKNRRNQSASSSKDVFGTL
ncbi:hypothetical protein BXZ70DRAFT_614597 [Cristinia sonorae]|uniref:Telomere-associated protein Rif1 N-terminal domain-containing protein n=1 Tax=Cristinia sonorae TaxID=1940300 RepID=A0A8K0XT46_9AGAR|nr:hypothetical protein BXZ70DRAFT_614597 [Cristinia sonorae]